MKSSVEEFEGAASAQPSAPLAEGENAWRRLGQSGSEREVSAMPPADSATRSVAEWIAAETGLSDSGSRQLADYFIATYRALGVIPSQKKLVLERFFDESGGMQLVIHAPFGIRVNRAWGLALRKRFCRSFNFELQAAATDDAIVLSLGTQHSFPLDEVFHYLHSNTVREILVQALLDAPMFPIHWRWNATRALALPRQRGGRKIPAPLQRMESENLLAAVFPDQLACLENIAGDRVVPDHPLVQQTIDDCLTKAMDIEGLIKVLKQIESGAVECIARDLPEPSPLAHEILNARPYAFLDNAPLEERRTQAVYTRRAGESSHESGLGILDAAAIEKVCAEAWPRAANADELHEALLLTGLMTEDEIGRVTQVKDSELNGLNGLNKLNELNGASGEVGQVQASDGVLKPTDSELNGLNELHGAGGEGRPVEASTGSELTWLAELVAEKRAGQMTGPNAFWVAAERLPMVQTVYPDSRVEPPLVAPEFELKRKWDRADAVRELVRGRMEVSGPITARTLAEFFALPQSEIDSALFALEAEGFILRGKFHADASDLEWCDRRLLARIHRLTINRLRAEIQPVSIAEFQRFLLAWQRVDAEHRAEGPEGVEAVLELLDGYELPAAAWEPEVLALRVKDYTPQWLDQLCFTGRIGWGRLSLPQSRRVTDDPPSFRTSARQAERGVTNGEAAAPRLSGPVRSSPVSLFSRENLAHWLVMSTEPGPVEFSPDTKQVFDTLLRGGALFFGEIIKQTGLLPSRVEQALGELTAQGVVTSDSFEGLRALLVPSEKRAPFAGLERKRRHKSVTSVEFAGRWLLLRADNRGSRREEAPARKSEVRSQRSEGVQSLLTPAATIQAGDERNIHERENAVEAFARVLLRRYGVMFRRLLERESLNVSWYELGRAYRRLEARGEIRGGYFVSGVSGEQFALPEAIGLLRSIRKSPAEGELITISGADPLNLAGVLTPGPRITAIAPNRILLRDGAPIAALEAGQIVVLEPEAAAEMDGVIERALRIGAMPVSLRRYYA